MENRFYQFQCGDYACCVLSDGSFTAKASALFAGGPPGERESALRDLGVANLDSMPSQYQPFYLDTGQHKILIDTGYGVSKTRGRGNLLKSMAAAEIAPESIDIVIFTHMHLDHFGGNCDENGQPHFPNARYIAWKSEWDHFAGEAEAGAHPVWLEYWRRNMLALQDHFQFVDTECEILPGVQIITAFGHSPGHIALLITSGEEKLLHVGDALHQPWHANFPDWSPRYDMQPAISPASRRKLLRLAVEENVLLFAYHFPFPGLGHVAPWNDTWNWTSLET